MKLLLLYHISPYPPKYGVAKRNFHLLVELAKQHELTVVSNGTEEEERGFRRYFEKHVKRIVFIRRERPRWANGLMYILNTLAGRATPRLFLSHAMQEAVDDVMSEGEIDAVICSVLHLGFLRFPPGVPLIGNTQNVEYDVARRSFREADTGLRKIRYFLEYHALRREELRVARKFHLILPSSERDREIFARDLPDLPMVVIDNGVDTEYFAPRDDAAERNTVVFTGAMSYYPNDHGIRSFLDHVWPLIRARITDARLCIVGTDPSAQLLQRASDDVVITGYVNDVRDYMARAGVFIMPLFIGGGTRIKALEAMAMKKAIVSTTIGCEGLPVRHDTSVLIADSPEEFASAVVRVLGDQALARRLGEAGYGLVHECYRWEKIAANLEDALDATVRLVSPARLAPEAPAAPVRSAHPRVRTVSNIRVLLYHRVVADNVPADDFCIPREVFRRQLEFLERMGYTAVTFEDIRLNQEGKINLPRKPVVITFDDGYAEVYSNALPIMQEMGMPGVVFVIGDRSIRSNIWDEEEGMTEVSLLDDHQVLALDRAGFEIGSHSLTHPMLPDVEPERAWTEIQQSRVQLEILLNKPVHTFSYPFGLVNEDLKRMVEEAGYRTGCAAWSGPVAMTKDLFEVRRILVRGSGGVRGLALQMLFPYSYYRWGWWRLKEAFWARRGLRM